MYVCQIFYKTRISYLNTRDTRLTCTAYIEKKTFSSIFYTKRERTRSFPLIRVSSISKYRFTARNKCASETGINPTSRPFLALLKNQSWFTRISHHGYATGGKKSIFKASPDSRCAAILANRERIMATVERRNFTWLALDVGGAAGRKS